MTRHLQREVNKLKRKILELGKSVQQSLDDALTAVVERDIEMAQAVMDTDADIDRAEVDTEEECLKLLALYQPVAIDLRFIIATLKVNNDLERIGDLAVNIAAQAISFAESEKIKAPFDLKAMAEKVQDMVASSMQSLVNMDVELARQVWTDDDQVDFIHRQMYSQVVREIKRYPARSETLIRYLSVSRYLERIADHATNIAEDVVYMVEGEIKRHGALAESEEERKDSDSRSSS
jgi:phosphate transport system protein